MTKLFSTILSLIAAFFLLFGLSGCVELTGNISKTNKQIATSNENNLKAFSAAMAACDGEQGCLVGVAMAFAGGLGRQSFYRPDTVLDWIRALNQPLDTVLRYTAKQGDGSGGAAGSLVLKGDQNIVNVGNTAEHRGSGSLVQDLSTSAQPYKEHRTWTQDGQSQSNGTSSTEGTPKPESVASAEVSAEGQ